MFQSDDFGSNDPPPHDPGTSPEPEAAQEAVLRRCFEELETRNALLRLDLAYTVTSALMSHLYATQHPAVVAEYFAQTAKLFDKQANLLKAEINRMQKDLH